MNSSLIAWASSVAALTATGSLGAVRPPPGGGTPPPDAAIAFADKGVRVMNADGTNVTTVVSVQPGEIARMPAWSPDNSRIVYWGRHAGVSGVWTAPVAGGSRVLVTPTAATSPTPVDWSPVPTPDGQHKILFSDTVSYPPLQVDRDIFLVNPDGTGRVNLTISRYSFEPYAAWAPDARQLAVSRSSTELVILDLDLVGGSLAVVGETVAYTDTGGAVFPKWANTSEHVAFSTSMNSLLRVVTLDIADPFASPVLLTSSASADQRWASFSPDDARLAFHEGGASGGIYTVRTDGTSRVRINTKGVDPCWRRP